MDPIPLKLSIEARTKGNINSNSEYTLQCNSCFQPDKGIFRHYAQYCGNNLVNNKTRV